MAIRIPRPHSDEYHPRFDSEIGGVPDADDFGELLRQQVRDTARFVSQQFGESGASARYGPDKWTAREVIGHLSDVERILCYRALRIARGDATVLPGFDENAYVPAAEFERRPMQSVLDEFLSARSATIGFVEGLTDDFAARRGNVGSGTMTVRALLYLIAGHEIHHRTLLRDRYLPLVAAATR
jgi:uncharacterized damage-inducible protein DinB